MGYIPNHQDWSRPETAVVPITITIAALKEDKRPIGFAPWPEPAKPKRPRKKPV